MANTFDYFVILAGMRTGSNYLESSLNAYAGIECLGELFNPRFVGFPKQNKLHGFDLSKRDTDPVLLIEKVISKTAGLPGFRFFFDHDPRVLATCLADPRCAKIVLRRNLLDTYVSREIARETNQWRLSKMQDARSAKIQFQMDDYLAHVAENQKFISQISSMLQQTGQTAFPIEYGDLSNVDVLNGLASFLGVADARKLPSGKTKKQNPGSLRDKVTNYDHMAQSLGNDLIDNLDREQVFEPPRGASIPTYIAAQKAPLLFMPIKSGPTEAVRKWLSDLGGDSDDLADQVFDQKKLRQWKRKSRNHRCFTVIRHPVPRLFDAYVRHILLPGEHSFLTIRNTLISSFGLPLPDYEDVGKLDASAHREGFLAFARFVQGNLNGQTSIRVDPAWASQSEILRGMGEFNLPDHIFREDDLENGLEFLTHSVGMASPMLKPQDLQSPFSLKEIYNADVEAAVRACYQRDYMMFGFGAWPR